MRSTWQEAVKQTEVGLAIALVNKGEGLRFVNEDGKVWALNCGDDKPRTLTNTTNILRLARFYPVSSGVIASIANTSREAFTVADINNAIMCVANSRKPTPATVPAPTPAPAPVGLRATMSRVEALLVGMQASVEEAAKLDYNNPKLEYCLDQVIIKALELKKLL